MLKLAVVSYLLASLHATQAQDIDETICISIAGVASQSMEMRENGASLDDIFDQLDIPKNPGIMEAALRNAAVAGFNRGGVERGLAARQRFHSDVINACRSAVNAPVPEESSSR